MRKTKKELDQTKLTEDEAKFLLSEPITWSWVAIEIGKGVLAAIGAKIFNSIFSKGVNIEQLLRNLIKEVDKIITLRIEESSIADAIDKAKTIDFILRQYLNSPTRERLNLIYEYSAYLVNRFERFKHKTYKEYILSINFQLVALEELYLTIPQEKKNIIDLLNRGKEHILQLDKDWKNISDSRFSIKRKIRRIGGGGPLPSPQVTIIYYYVAEGDKRLTDLIPSESTVKQQLEQIKKQRYNTDIVEVYTNPSSEVIKLWDKRIKQLSQ